MKHNQQNRLRQFFDQPAPHERGGTRWVKAVQAIRKAQRDHDLARIAKSLERLAARRARP